jgi:fructokinase
VRPILGVGELLWDVYPDGRKVAGGSPFNFAYHCHALGHPAQVVTAVGDDDLGRELRHVVRDLGMSDALIQTVPYPTGTVRVTLDAAGVPSYAIAENVAWDHLTWTPELAALTPAAVQFGTLAQRGASAGVVRRLTALTAFAVFDVNLRQPRVDAETLSASLRLAAVVKLTDDELATVGALLPGGRGPVWLTLGERGAECRSPDGGVVRQPAFPATVVDTVGAGDAFAAAMTVKTLAGVSPREALRFACEYAAGVCEHAGAIPPRGGS